MSPDEIKDKVYKIVAEKAEIPVEQITPEASFNHDLALDSLAILDLIMGLEDAFQITIPDEKAEEVKTVQDAIDFLHKHLS